MSNSELQTADVCLVAGANDSVHRRGRQDVADLPMPVIHAGLDENVVFVMRSIRLDFAGIENELLYNPKATLVFGDAKGKLTKMVAAVKAN
ncbi:MAG: NAD(P)(+) transhydrogenase (Re/Si-specific) subunit beta [Acidimicrobiales bacterium]